MTSAYPEIQKIYDDLDAADRDARAVAEGLTDAQGTWRQAPGSWSVAECLDHLAVANCVYIASMRGAAEFARARGRMRRGPARPGVLGAWFVRYTEPPVRTKIRTNQKITPRPSGAPGQVVRDRAELSAKKRRTSSDASRGPNQSRGPARIL